MPVGTHNAASVAHACCDAVTDAQSLVLSPTTVLIILLRMRLIMRFPLSTI